MEISESRLDSPVRLSAVESLGLLDPLPDPHFDRLARLARRIFAVPIALVSIFGKDKEIFRGASGLPEPLVSSRQLPLAEAISKEVAITGSPLFASDLGRDPSFVENPTVRRLKIGGFGAVPLRTPEEQIVGALCVIDHSTRDWSQLDKLALADLAEAAMTEIALRHHRALKDRLMAAISTKETRKLLWEQEEILSLAEESAGIGVWDHEIATGITRGTPQFFRIMGLDPTLQSVPIETLRALRHPDDRDRVVDGFRKALAEHSATYESEYRIRRADGQTRWIFGRGRIVRDSEGRPVRYSGVDIDITSRKGAEIALRKSERRLAAVLNNATVAIFLMNEDHRCVYLNAAAEHLLGYSIEELKDAPFAQMVRRGASSTGYNKWITSTGQRVQGTDVFYHKDGASVPVAYAASWFHDDQDRIAGIILEARDIRVEKEHERRVNTLINELNHRVKNNLAVVQSIVSQTLKATEASADTKRAIESRLIAIARSHDILTGEDWRGADLEVIVEQALLPFRVEGTRDVSIAGPPVYLTPKAALAFSMALHELATNALKYGALKAAGGRLKISWSLSSSKEASLTFSWEESGGPDVRPPKKRGFGSALIEEVLPLELGGIVKTEFATQGLKCTIVMPLDRLSPPQTTP
jgi:PAS domain S-box-containing protein